jgi:hypothetical protein
MSDEPVGYKNPPKHSRFTKGQSGNPRGRPKKPPTLAEAVAAELAEVIKVTEGGKVRKITKLRSMVKALTAASIRGNIQAARLLVQLAERASAETSVATAAAITAEEQKLIDEFLEREAKARAAKLKGGA